MVVNYVIYCMQNLTALYQPALFGGTWDRASSFSPLPHSALTLKILLSAGWNLVQARVHTPSQDDTAWEVGDQGRPPWLLCGGLTLSFLQTVLY